MNEDMRLFVDVLTLAFHEARNVRHLVKDGKLAKAPFRVLIDGLPTNKYEAWKALQPLRAQAVKAPSAASAEAVFCLRFGLSLEQLAELSSSPHWAGTARGGNQWVKIERAAIALRDAIDNEENSRVADLMVSIPEMRHNTGSVVKKLADLDASIE